MQEYRGKEVENYACGKNEEIQSLYVCGEGGGGQVNWDGNSDLSHIVDQPGHCLMIRGLDIPMTGDLDDWMTRYGR